MTMNDDDDNHNGDCGGGDHAEQGEDVCVMMCHPVVIVLSCHDPYDDPAFSELCLNQN